ncbi:MAG: hypothetical protein GYA87_09825 [Christensenellaceae bacterium]|nr:hypothetical protein [Christensenellaceae bacterium]
MKYKIKKTTNLLIFFIITLIVLIIGIFSKSFPQILINIIKNSEENIKQSIVKEENFYTQNIYFKNIFLETYSAYAKVFDRRELNGVIKLNNSYLHIPNNVIKNLDNKVNNIIKLKESIDIPFVFVSMPDTISKNTNLLPKSKNNHVDVQTDKIIDELKQNNVMCIDFRQDNIDTDFDYMYFKTDHHIKPLYAFDLYVNLLSEVENKLNIKVNDKFTNISNYNIKTYKDIFLGTAGKRTGRAFGGLDDFNLISPKFNTSFKLNSSYGYFEGDYNKVFVDESFLVYNYYEINVYKAYAGNVYTNMSVQNLNNDACDKNILIIGDSSTMPTSCFMACAFKNINVVDLRYQEDGFSLQDYINNIDPDIVIMQYSPMVLSDNKAFDF